MSIRRSLIVVVCLLASVVPLGSRSATPKQFVLSPEDNQLWVYDAETGERAHVIQAVNGTSYDQANSAERRDINGQICVSPDRTHMITGEDTVDGVGSSHDPSIAGWGYFALSGSTLGTITATQVGKLSPEAPGTGPGYAGDPDNFGCGFLDDDRILTTAIGNTLPGEAATGQLFLWFADPEDGFTKGFAHVSDGGATFQVGAVQHCSLDDTLATAGGITIDDNGDVYVATNRPDDSLNPGGIWRYRGAFPSNLSECTPEWLASHLTRTLVIPTTNLVPVGPFAPTPSSVVVSPDDTLYVASVFTGTVSEFTKDGRWLRDIWPVSPIAPRTGPTTETPFGLAVTADGSLWIADLGIALAFPLPGQGSLIKVPFLDTPLGRTPMPLGEKIAEGLTYPDGLGIYEPSV